MFRAPPKVARYLRSAGATSDHPSSAVTPTGDEVLGGPGPGRVGEAEARVAEATGDHPAALEEQLGVAAHRPGAQSRPSRPWPAGRPARPSHPRRAGARAISSACGSGSGAARLTGPARSFSIRKIDGGDEVGVVDPGDVLPTAGDRTAEPEPGQPEQDVEDATAVRAHHHRRAQRDPSGGGQVRLGLRLLPAPGDPHAVLPVERRVGTPRRRSRRSPRRWRGCRARRSGRRRWWRCSSAARCRAAGSRPGSRTP